MLTCKDIVRNYIEYVTDGLECRTEGRFTVISTPYLYSDGDLIELFVEQYGDKVRISDLGETARKLAVVNFNWNTSRARALFSHIINSTGVGSSKGILYVILGKNDNIGGRIADLIQAVQQTDNLLFTVQGYAARGFRDDVEEYLRKEGFEPELNYEIEGESGITWRVHFHLNHGSNVLLKALSATSKGGAKHHATTTYTTFSDIKRKYSKVIRSIILDDGSPIWEADVISLIQAQLDIELGYWSKREDFTEQLRISVK